jgi:hypothetical protein
LDAIAGIGDTSAIDASLASGAGGASLDTSSIDRAADLAFLAGFACTRIVNALCFYTDLFTLAASEETSCISADLIYTDGCSGAICIDFAGQITDALAIVARLTAWAGDAKARIGDALIAKTDALAFTRVGLAVIRDTTTADADLALLALNA